MFSVSRAEWVDLSVNPNFSCFMSGVALRTTLLVNIRKKVVRSIFVRIIVSDPHPSHSPSCLLLNMELKGEDIFGNPTVLVSHTQKSCLRKIFRGSMDKEDNKRAFTSFMFRNRSRIFYYQF